ncbi:MAG TPA: hypothetical protein VF189_03325 [Patescibacteria group bacterium]
MTTEKWDVKEHPGYLGKTRPEKMAEWDNRYGSGNWRLSHWQNAKGEMLTYDQVFKVYVEGYEKYFKEHVDEADFLIKNYAYAYDHDMITKEEAFDSHAYYNKPGFRNQFHNVALNIALVNVTGRMFEGSKPIQVREGVPGTPDSMQPEGFMWSPGRIKCVDPRIIPQVNLTGEIWWQDGTIEDFYQKAKVLEVKRRVNS